MRSTYFHRIAASGKVDARFTWMCAGISKRCLIFLVLPSTYRLEHPPRLPRYGQDVVLLLLADELYAHRAYHHRLLAIFRCLPARPIYLDGIPTSAKHLSYLAHYSYKYFQYAKGLLSIIRNRERPHIHESTTRTMMIPLGCFAHFEPDVIPMCNRDFDYAFLGSVTYNASEKKWFHAVMESPKEFARRVMCESIREVSLGESMARISSYDKRYERKYQQSVELCRHPCSV